MNWIRVKLGEACIIEKGKVGIQKAIPGKYPLVVTGEQRLSHNEYHFDKNAVIVPLVSSTGHGHKSLKRIHFQTGKFAVGNILCAIIPKDETFLKAEYIYRYLVLNKEQELVRRMKGMANVSLPIKEIEKIEIPVPPIVDQIHFIANYQKLENTKEELTIELTHQQDLLKQLRQAFLREAMQGKLTAEFRGSHTELVEGSNNASELLKRIKAEKEKLIADKKLKKEKPLPPIKAEEIPFEIPGNWVWCRLGELALHSEAGQSFKCLETSIKDDEWGVIKVSAVSWDTFFEDQNKFYSKNKPNNTSAQVRTGDFLISRANTSELVGKSVVVKNVSKNLLLSDKTIRFKFSEFISTDFINLCNNSLHGRKYYSAMGSGSSPSMKNITRDHMKNLSIPLPPLPEQSRIVKKLDELMKLCDEMQESIQQSKDQNERLLQQVLREALQPKTKEVEII